MATSGLTIVLRVELNGIHEDDGEGHKLIKRSTLERRKRKTKPYDDLMAKVYVMGFYFYRLRRNRVCGRVYSMDSHTFKRLACLDVSLHQRILIQTKVIC